MKWDIDVKVDRLGKFVRGQVLADEEILKGVQTDFGHIVEKVPEVVVLPSDAGDVQRVVEIANEEGWNVSTRGAGHSQGGQSLSQGGILIDMSGLNRIGSVEEKSVRVQSGVLWRDLVVQTAERGLIPPVLTNNLNVTVGGALSMAGLGVASHRYGTQADNVEELEVVTGEGHRVCCSPSQNPELFNCSRCGLGQFAIITEARLKLRKFEPRVRCYYLLYDSLRALMDDLEKVLEEERADYIECWAAPCVQGFRGVAGNRMSFAEWFYPVQFTIEYASDPPQDDFVLADLAFYRRVHVEDGSLLEFVNRLESVFDHWRQIGTWSHAHPWMEAILPWETAVNYIEGVLKDFPPNLLVGGQVLMLPSRGTISSAPLFRHPKGKLVMGVGILPAVSKQFLPKVFPILSKASELCLKVGGKRYLSGWIEFEHDQWKDHFGSAWLKLVEWKQFYDPKGVLNPGFINYESD